MRKNTANVVTKFEANLPVPRRTGKDSIWTDGQTIFSYGTPILTRVSRSIVVFNTTKYSVTTTIHQNALAAYFARNGYTVWTVDNVERGTRDDLFKLWMNS